MASKKIFGVSKKGVVDVRYEPEGTVFTKTAQKAELVQNIMSRNVRVRGQPSVAVLDVPMSSKWNYFEIQILNEGAFHVLAIGLGPPCYSLTRMPGWDIGSIAYHADDGSLFHSTPRGRIFGLDCHLKDAMGCGVDYSSQEHGYVTVWFTRNGKLAGPPEKFPLPKDGHGLYPLIGLSTLNESVLYTGHSCVPPPYSEVPADPKGPDVRVFPKCTTVKAVYPYEAHLPDELTLSPGDVVEVTNWDFGSRPKWAKGRALKKNENGLFFTGFVQPVLTEEMNMTKGTQCYCNTYREREYVFGEKPEEWLECLICRELAHDPHQSSCCGHTLCLRCATKWKKKSDSCVNCRREPFEFQKDPRAERLVTGLSVFCPNTRHGCEWKGTLGRVEPHLDTTCVFGYLNKQLTPDSIVDCPCCARSVVDKVTQKKLSCGRMKYSEVVKYHYKTCSDWPMRCPNRCPDPLTRVSLPVHLGVDCMEEIVSCDFSSMGCTVRSKRKEMKKHVVEDVAQHLTVLLSDHMRIKERQTVLANELEKTKEENLQLQQKVAELSKKKKFF